jgi:hypothetical protein
MAPTPTTREFPLVGSLGNANINIALHIEQIREVRGIGKHLRIPSIIDIAPWVS